MEEHPTTTTPNSPTETAVLKFSKKISKRK
jgi:hypothetical protein